MLRISQNVPIAGVARKGLGIVPSFIVQFVTVEVWPKEWHEEELVIVLSVA